MRTYNEILNILFDISKEKKAYQFDNLYRLLYREDFYIQNYNEMSGTRGINDISADSFTKANIKKLVATLKNNTYLPKSMKRSSISKKDKKQRLLEIPSFDDKIIQSICTKILESIYEPIFSKYSHGFRPQKSCQSALIQIKKTFTGVTYFVKGDIVSFFETINHEVLINVLKKKIKDIRFLNLIRKFLKAGYLEDWESHKILTPQGLLGPILANIYLNELDTYVQEELKTKYCKESSDYNLEYGKQILNTQEVKYDVMEYKNFQYVRYVDNFIIGVCGSKALAQQIKEDIKIYLESYLQLNLSEEKTLIAYSTKPVKFLNYEIKTCTNQATKHNKNNMRIYNRKIILLIPKGKVIEWAKENAMIQDFHKKPWKIIHRNNLIPLSDFEKMNKVNREIRDKYNYYSLAENVSTVLGLYRYICKYSLLKTYAFVYKTSLSKIINKYKIDKDFGIGYTNLCGEKCTIVFHNTSLGKQKT